MHPCTCILKLNDCCVLRRAPADSLRVRAAGQKFHDGSIRWKELRSQLAPVGNALAGVAGPGKNMAPVVQDVTGEMEQNLGADALHGAKGFWSLLTEDVEETEKEMTRNEIGRRNLANEIFKRKMNQPGCD